MRVIVPFLGVIASLVTIAAGFVRLRWSWVQQKVHDSPHVGREALPTWVKRVLTIWLISIASVVTFVFLYAVVKSVIELSN